ncbi:hypothetical protein [Pseudomonas phage PA1C]|uniref:Uncharacterized protein n=1 Tax=Pseudomonas phage vB_PaeM_PS119XW TaxID=2601632 RepID=A0A5C1K7W4_9CAUD|nr:hypothetical protein PP933_gp256 [Pseudomonas phage vB_PaeM_PS119XW]QBX32414.1 hypothetical protein [Pseudomonas phage PA1C]QEM41985.1 hypothetical protein [Pseudomonas phage vB_PaeM_PS119XW]
MIGLFKMWRGFRQVHSLHREGTQAMWFRLQRLDPKRKLFNPNKMKESIALIDFLTNVSIGLGDEFTCFLIESIGDNRNCDIIARELREWHRNTDVLAKIFSLAYTQENAAAQRYAILLAKELSSFMPENVYLWYSRVRFAVRKQLHELDKGRPEPSPWEANL